jgi:DNA-binding beta-propeller fold protein YncE
VGCVLDWAGRFGTPGLADGTANNARFGGLFALATDATYIYASTAHAIRRIKISDGMVDTFAGSGVAGNHDGIGTAASFSCPKGLAVKNGRLYVADSGNDRIREINLATRQVTTLNPSISAPSFLVARDSDAQLHVSLPAKNEVWRFDPGAGQAALINTNSNPLDGPQGLVWISEWSLFYVADSDNHVIRKISDTGTGSPQVGQLGSSGYADGPGDSIARLNRPYGMTRRETPNVVFIADRDNHAIRAFAPGAYALTTVMGNGAAGHAVDVLSYARFTEPTDVLFHAGSLYIAEGTVIRRATF